MAEQLSTTNGTEVSPVPSTAPANRTASLYVGDLNPDVSEATLYEVFKQIGKVESIRVCRNASTRDSLGYAYVNYANEEDADRAIDTHNFHKINGRPCRIMWSRRDPSLRKSGVGNIFIKNLHPTTTSQHLYDALSSKGTILSCKVAVDGHGKSKGYGFVHFEKQSEADRAIEEFQAEGALLNGHKVFIGPFIPRKDRQVKSSTSIVLRNLESLKIDDLAKFREFLSKNTTLNSEEIVPSILAVEGHVFGFIYFKENENIEKVLESLKNNNQTAALNVEAVQNFTNIYAKNIDRATVNSTEKLNEFFSKYGKITSSQLMVDESGQSKGFGFVNFENFEAAFVAIELLNNKEFNGIPLYVSKAQSRSERDNFLANLRQKIQQERKGVNLYVKHLDDNVDESKLTEIFSPFGEITSVKIMRNDKVSRGFGFVCFATPDQAAKALASMNNFILEGKPIYVSFAQSYSDRKNDLARMHSVPMQRGMIPGMPPFVLPPFNPFPYPPPRAALNVGPHHPGVPLQRPPPGAMRGAMPPGPPPGYSIPQPVPRNLPPMNPGRPPRGSASPVGQVRNPRQHPPGPAGPPPVPLSSPVDELPIFTTIFESEFFVGSWKETYGDIIAKRIQTEKQYDDNLVFKITGMIIDEIEHSLQERTPAEVAAELFAILYAHQRLEEKIREAISVLKEGQQQ